MGDNSAEAGRGMVVLQGIVDESVVDTAICICQIQPGAMVLVGLRDGSRQLGVLLQAAWYSREEGLLDRGVQIAIGHHEGEPSVLQDGGEELPHT